MIYILATGGTLEKDYFAEAGELGFYPQSRLGETLDEARVTQPYMLESLFQIDSLKMTQTQRGQILAKIEKTPHSQILVTHGTDTLVQTQSYLNQAWLNNDLLQTKTIVLTGAMRPLALGKSDGQFNLGFAMAAVQLLQPGVYIAINGQIFKPGQVMKDRQRGIFTQMENSYEA